MSLRKRTPKGFHILIAAALIIQLSGCGYLLYPERRGQRSGRIDPGVAILDGVGILLFLVPGLIAFAVDFASGAIYLPARTPRRSSLSAEEENVRVVRFNPSRVSGETIHEIVECETGLPLGMILDRMEVYPLEGSEEIRPVLARLDQSGYRPASGWAQSSLRLN